jgi:hypothetical protein
MGAIADCMRVPVEDGEHNIACTYRDEVSVAMPTFFSERSSIGGGVLAVSINSWRS